MVAICTGIYLLILLAFLIGRELLRRSRLTRTSARHQR